jgi:hypothetical protein
MHMLNAGDRTQVLQQELLEQVLRLAHDPRTILNALAASKALRLAAAQLIDCIVVHELAPPAHTWESFHRATRVRIHRSRDGNEHLDFLGLVLATLPSRITAIEDLDDESTEWTTPSQQASLGFAQALVASACCSNLLSVKLSSGLLTPEAADIILQGLPRLQEARLSIDASQASAPGQQQVWSPKAQSCQDLAHLQISYDGLSLDLSGLSSATKLQRLSVYLVAATNLAGLQALTNLQHLDLASTECLAASWAVLAKLPKLDTLEVQTLEISASAAAAAVTSLRVKENFALQHDDAQLPGCLARQLPQLQHVKLGPQPAIWWVGGPQGADMRLARALQGHQQLKQLHAPTVKVSAAAWALLAALPMLETADVRQVSIDAAAPAAAALTNLQCRGLLRLWHTAQQVRGCLTRQLPQLQHLRAYRAHVLALAAALAGHQELQHLRSYHDEAAGPSAGWGQDVLAELASCSQLQELELKCYDVVVTAAGCAALAAGACRESLRVVRLEATVVDPALLAPLLQPDMAAMQEVVFGLPEGFDRSAVQQQVEQVLPPGGGWQWDVGYETRLNAVLLHVESPGALHAAGASTC